MPRSSPFMYAALKVNPSAAKVNHHHLTIQDQRCGMFSAPLISCIQNCDSIMAS
jgi:hypothetical protein